jgi:hypothetical protein
VSSRCKGDAALTLEFDDLALFGYLDQLGAELDAELWEMVRRDARSGRIWTHGGVRIGHEALVRQADEQGRLAHGRIAWRSDEREDVQGSRYTPVMINLRT